MNEWMNKWMRRNKHERKEGKKEKERRKERKKESKKERRIFKKVKETERNAPYSTCSTVVYVIPCWWTRRGCQWSARDTSRLSAPQCNVFPSPSKQKSPRGRRWNGCWDGHRNCLHPLHEGPGQSLQMQPTVYPWFRFSLSMVQVQSIHGSGSVYPWFRFVYALQIESVHNTQYWLETLPALYL